MNWLLVFVGGGAGAVCRYAVARWLPPPDLAAGGIPWATFVANLLACIVLGVGLGFVVREQMSKSAQLLLLTGFCGGFSTFSTLAAEMVGLVETGHTGQAFWYLLGSVLVGCLGLFFVLWVVRGEG